MKFEGKVILITGASSGIGAGTAKYFASEKASLALTGRNEANLTKVAEECKKLGSPNVLTIVADLTKESDVQRIVDETINKFGKLNVLVNNAGISNVSSIQNTTLENFDRIFNTNVRAVYQLTMLAVPFLIKTKGNVVNVSSVAGTRVFTDCLAYCMSKSALDQFTKCVALELAPKGVRVNSVNPGVIETDIFRRIGMDDAAQAKLYEDCKRSHPLGRSGIPKDVAKTIGYLASDDASFVTGELLHTDGGLHIVSPMGKWTE